MAIERYRVLLIDDDANLRTLLKLLLEHEGYEVLLAPDGDIGLTIAETSRPDVILLDMAMPHRSGLDVYLDLQNNPITSSIPVLICSAALTRPEVQRWYRLPNVLEVIAKPFDINALIRRIEAAARSHALAA